jgi:hypothetical protein
MTSRWTASATWKSGAIRQVRHFYPPNLGPLGPLADFVEPDGDADRIDPRRFPDSAACQQISPLRFTILPVNKIFVFVVMTNFVGAQLSADCRACPASR